MARLSTQKISQELYEKGYTLVDDKNYTSLSSLITIKCPKEHLIETSLSDFRRASFTCPVCDKNINFINPRAVPAKNGAYRVIAFDQATEHFGLSIFDNGQLVFYSLYNFNGTMVNRLVKIRKFIDEIVIREWQPDYIVMEDIQCQHGAILTFKVLAMLFGVIQELCSEREIPYEAVSPNVWRKYAGTCGKNRREEKMLSVAVVKEKYNVRVSDDVAEAILIGRYGAMMHKPTMKLGFGKK